MELMPPASPWACLPTSGQGEVLGRTWTVDYRGNTHNRSCWIHHPLWGMVVGGHRYRHEAPVLVHSVQFWVVTGALFWGARGFVKSNFPPALGPRWKEIRMSADGTYDNTRRDSSNG
jgi:hypothetical protein